MKLLAVGDVCGSVGCEMARRTVPLLKRKYGIDAVIINGENSADGNGVTPQSAQSLFAAGADVITGGNHSLRRREILTMLEENPFLLRPDNVEEAAVGSGYCTLDFGFVKMAVINLAGVVGMRQTAGNPYLAAERLLGRARDDGARVTVVDFHAELTGEKKTLAFDVDGIASVVFGTHTHVQTADEQILPGGTAYITDLGMTGPACSVLGVRPEIMIERLRNGTNRRMEPAGGACRLDACIFEIDCKTGRAIGVERISVKEGSKIEV